MGRQVVVVPERTEGKSVRYPSSFLTLSDGPTLQVDVRMRVPPLHASATKW